MNSILGSFKIVLLLRQIAVLKRNYSCLHAIITLLLPMLIFSSCARFQGENTADFGDKTFIYLKKDATIEDVYAQMKEHNVLNDISAFKQTAESMNLGENIRGGKYKIEKGMNNYDIVNMLKKGKQEVVKLVINKKRTKAQIAKKIASKIEADSASFMRIFNDNAYLKQFGLDSNQIQSAVMPYTYDFYWNTTAEEAFEKIVKAHLKFWNDKRKAKAAKLGLTIHEVIAVASLVDEETNAEKDRGLVASVYLNRLKKGMLLQADPAVRFAMGDFTIKRVLKKDLQIESPYNSYKYTGLPPGPICTPRPGTIDAVLDAPQTDYIFFCADENLKGGSNFAATYEEHQANAKRYQKALDDRGVTR